MITEEMQVNSKPKIILLFLQKSRLLLKSHTAMKLRLHTVTKQAKCKRGNFEREKTTFKLLLAS